MQDGLPQGGSFSVAADAAAAVRARWSASPAPSPRDILTPWALAGDDALAETLAADAEERRRRGLPARLEDYLGIEPSIADRPSACRAVLMGEIVARAGEPDDALRADLVARFPALAGEIDAVMGLAALLRDATGEALPVRGPGSRLGKYRLHSRLGEGAFGEVWQAWDTELERYIALKILRRAHHFGSRGVQRFLAEVRAAAALDHEAVVRVHGAGQFAETGEYFIDAQLVGEASPTEGDPRAIRPGGTLEQRLARGPVPAPEAAALIAAAARGVAAAHARGITHRDIKPSNILLGADARPLVADFGLSVSGFASRPLRGAGGAPGGPGSASAVSAPVAGTPAYMAPEQARGEAATPLSDVYSLGATLRALLSGGPAYVPDAGKEGSARDQVMALARAGRMRPLLEACPRLPRTLCAICDRACATDPLARYSSAEQLSADLGAFLAHRPTLADAPGALGGAVMWCRRHALTSIVAAAALFVIISATAAFLHRVTQERDRALAAESEASRQRDAAIATRDVIETINAFLARTFESTRGREGTSEITVNEAIDLASGRVGRTFADRPLVEAGVRHFLGQAAMGAGNLAEARRQLERAWELRRDILGPTARDSLATRLRLAELAGGTEAEAAYLEILEPLRAAAGDEAPDTLRVISQIGSLKRQHGDLPGAVEMLERAAAGYRRTPQLGTTHRQMNLNWLVLTYVDLKQNERAERAQREIIAMNEADLGPDDISTLNATQALGWVLRLERRHDEAISLYRDVLARYQSTVGPTHVNTLHVEVELAATLIDKDPEEAVRLARKVVAGAETHGRGNQNLLRGLIVLGRALIAAGRADEAEPVLRRALEACIEHRGLEHQWTRESARVLIGALERQGRRAEADKVRAEVLVRPDPPTQPTPDR